MGDKAVDVAWSAKRRVEIRYTGNLRGDLNILPHLATVIKQQRQKCTDILLVDTGNFSAGSEVVERHKGRPVAEVMAHLAYDAVVPGQHEAAWGIYNILELQELSRCPFLAANWKGASLPGWVFLQKEGVELLLIGLAHPEAPDGVESIDPRSAVREAIESCEEGVVIVISNLGYEVDRLLATECEVHVVLEGVPYKGFDQVVKVVNKLGQALIVPASPGGGFLGALGIDLSGISPLKT